MHIYIIMFLLSIILAYLSMKVKNKYYKIILQVGAIVPFVLVSAIRYDVGTDYFYRYVPNYLIFVKGGYVDSLEPLFILLIKICVKFSDSYVLLFVVTSIIINVLIMITIFKYSKNPILSIAIFFCGSFYFQSMNLVRQFIAMAIIFCAYRILLCEKKKFLYVIFILIATMFHSMSAVFLISLFLEKRVIKLKYLIIIILLVMILGGYIGNILEFIVYNTPLKDVTNIAKYIKYFKTDGNLNISTILVESIIYLYIYIMFNMVKKENKEIEKEAIFFVNMQSMTVLSTVMSMHFGLFFRIALLFSIFQILSIPYFWNINKNSEIKIKQYTLKRGTTVLTIIVLCFMASRMIFSNVIKGADEILPYKTIFQNKSEIKEK